MVDELEVEIEEISQHLAFNRKLPEFIDRTRFLEERLQEGEYLKPELGELDLSGKVELVVETMVLNLYGREEEPVKALVLSSLGRILCNTNLFSDYEPSSET